MDLRKVLGEENPADLLTKHSLSRQRLEGLVTRFGCKYLGGRAASAPQVRKGESSRFTMADADLDDDEVAAIQEETSPCMPHLMHSAAELDARYPPLVAPPDEGLADVADDRRDGVYQHGLKPASEIRDQATTQGRRRRPLKDDSTHGTPVLLRGNDQARQRPRPRPRRYGIRPLCRDDYDCAISTTQLRS